MRAWKGQSGAHSGVEAPRAASIIFQANYVEVSATPRDFAGEEFPCRLIGSIVDDDNLRDWVSLRINGGETPFKKRWTVPRYDDCHYSNHERTSLNYKRFGIIVPEPSFSFHGLDQGEDEPCRRPPCQA
jgi:hypothetical protein